MLVQNMDYIYRI